MRQRVVAGVVLLFVFVLGALAGVFVERHHYHSVARSGGPSAAEVHEAAMAEMHETLGLDEEQTEQIHAVLARHQQLVQRTWEQVRPEVQSAMREVHIEIAELLRPEQRERYHEWLSQQRDESQGDGVLIAPH
jgi:uncharacterized membrane protein